MCYSRRCVLCDTADIVCSVTQQTSSAVSHSRHRLRCHTADSVCCVAHQTCLLCDAADTVCCVAQQTVSVVSHSRRCLLCDSRRYLLCRTAECLAVYTETLSAMARIRDCLCCCAADRMGWPELISVSVWCLVFFLLCFVFISSIVP